MAKVKTVLFVLLFIGGTHLMAQDAPTTSQDASAGIATPKDMTEFGVSAGYAFVSGDVNSQFGFGTSLHLRKALDYVFSLRFDALYADTKGDDETNSINNRSFDNSWLSFTGFGVMSLNSFRYDRVNRKTNYYAMVGAGANYYKVDFSNENERRGSLDFEFSTHAAAGAGIAFRVSPRFNIGLEHQAFLSFGKRADVIDGATDNRGTFRDVLNYTNIKLNFNLGNPSTKSEPLYWINPLDQVIAKIDDVAERTDKALTDSDGDGVVDAVDQEPDTPSDVPVDTKGRTLDSDKDGVPDFRDKEPYYPPSAGEIVDEDGVVTNPVNRGGVTEERVQEMIDEALDGYGVTEQRGSVSEFFLPMIHFALDSYTIKYSDYGTLASIGQVMKGNPSARIVVRGYTDETGTEAYNKTLSYQRAKAVVDHLTTNHGIARGRLVIQYGGEENALVPKTSSYMNRRVEFRMAQSDDVEMDPPSGTNSTGDGY